MTHQKFEGERTLMRIHLGESDKWHGKPLHEAIVEILRKEGFSGATVLRGVGGYGGSSIYHTDKLLRLSQDLPIILEVIETQERIEQILPRLDEMVDGGLITLEKGSRNPLSRRQEIAGRLSLTCILFTSLLTVNCKLSLYVRTCAKSCLAQSHRVGRWADQPVQRLEP